MANVPLAVRAMNAGALDFIQKPFRAKAILDSIRSAISRVAEPQEAAALGLRVLRLSAA
jgi:FixJ family two-component response regulator